MTKYVCVCIDGTFTVCNYSYTMSQCFIYITSFKKVVKHPFTDEYAMCVFFFLLCHLVFEITLFTFLSIYYLSLLNYDLLEGKDHVWFSLLLCLQCLDQCLEHMRLVKVYF